MMRSAGDGAISISGAAAGEAGGSSIASPSATRCASASSTLRRLATMRCRTCSSDTLDSSNTYAEAVCACSAGCRESQNMRAWL